MERSGSLVHSQNTGSNTILLSRNHTRERDIMVVLLSPSIFLATREEDLTNIILIRYKNNIDVVLRFQRIGWHGEKQNKGIYPTA